MCVQECAMYVCAGVCMCKEYGYICVCRSVQE